MGRAITSALMALFILTKRLENIGAGRRGQINEW